jgi:hypothetical protein
MLYDNVRSERQMRATTGLSLEGFGKLSELFANSYQACHEISLKRKLENLAQRTVLASYEEMLFFVLFQLKNGLTYDVLGCIYAMDASTAQRNFERHLRILQLSLRQLQLLPKRGFEKVEELEQYLRAEQHLLIDATEIPIQRPVSQERQKQAYSGKKKPIG